MNLAKLGQWLVFQSSPGKDAMNQGLALSKAKSLQGFELRQQQIALALIVLTDKSQASWISLQDHKIAVACP